MTGTGRWIPFATLTATGALCLAFLVQHQVAVRGGGLNCIDLQVYRAGGHAVVSGHSLYASDFAAANHSPNGLTFTYPPFSALLFIPFAILPIGVAKVLLVTLNSVASVIIFVVVLIAAQRKWDRLRGWRSLTAPITAKTATVIFATSVVFLYSVSIRDNFSYGQINLLLAAAVSLDVLWRVPWPRGLLVGLALAVKLTPAVFVGYFAVTRQWRAMAVSLASAMTATAVGWLIMPSDTVRYFTALAFEPGRIGGLAYSSNQSVRGIVERIPALDAMRGVTWAVATIFIVALAVVAIEVSWRRRDTVAAVLSAALIGLLCSPVSWGHHWVWLPTIAVYFLARWAAFGGARNLVAGIAVSVVTLAAPWTHLPNGDSRERSWTLYQHLLGSVWAITGVVLLLWFATAGRAPRAGVSTGDDHKDAGVPSVLSLSPD